MFSTSTGITFTKADIVKKGNAVISYGQIHSAENTGTSVNDRLLRYIPESITNGKDNAILSNGDFLFADTSEDLEGCGNCVYNDKDYPIYAGYHSIICKPLIDINGKYIAYLFKTDEWRSQIRSRVYGVKVFSITQTILAQTSLILPPLAEQDAIALYLDEVTGKVDALIAEKQKQVEDLRAYRTSLITETVTRGLNPKASLRPSGIDWLGDIPSHWDVWPLKYLVSKPLMYGANESPEDDVNPNNPRYIRITDISENGTLRDETYRTLSKNKAQPYLLKIGDILFARSGATVGKTYRFAEEYACCFAGYLIKASLGQLVCSKFFQYYTNSICYQNWKNFIFDKSTIQNISAEKYNLLSVPVPSLDEQQAIADFLDEKTVKIDALIDALEKQLGELAEYKKSIISEAVTGKVDVRDWKSKN